MLNTGFVVFLMLTNMTVLTIGPFSQKLAPMKFRLFLLAC